MKKPIIWPMPQGRHKLTGFISESFKKNMESIQEFKHPASKPERVKTRGEVMVDYFIREAS